MFAAPNVGFVLAAGLFAVNENAFGAVELAFVVFVAPNKPVDGAAAVLAAIVPNVSDDVVTLVAAFPN